MRVNKDIAVMFFLKKQKIYVLSEIHIYGGLKKTHEKTLFSTLEHNVLSFWKYSTFDVIGEACVCVLEKNVFEVLVDYFIQFWHKDSRKKYWKNFSGVNFFGHSYHSHDTKSHMDVALIIFVMSSWLAKYFHLSLSFLRLHSCSTLDKDMLCTL